MKLKFCDLNLLKKFYENFQKITFESYVSGKPREKYYLFHENLITYQIYISSRYLFVITR